MARIEAFLPGGTVDDMSDERVDAYAVCFEDERGEMPGQEVLACWEVHDEGEWQRPLCLDCYHLTDSAESGDGAPWNHQIYGSTTGENASAFCEEQLFDALKVTLTRSAARLGFGCTPKILIPECWVTFNPTLSAAHDSSTLTV